MAEALLVDKSAGVTSHDVVAQIRREQPSKTKVGHAGTLDPFATGLLIILLGGATRLQRFLLDLPKTYVATARLGWRSSTGDPDGELTRTGRRPAELVLPTGAVSQRVPMTSAVRVDGERLYRKAHRGESIETPERTVTVHGAELLDADEERARFEIDCSSGTYIRTLVETLEDAYCEELRRTAIGPFRVPDGDHVPVTAAELTVFMPSVEIDAAAAAAVADGKVVQAEAGVQAPEWARPPGATPAPPGPEDSVRVRLMEGQTLVAIARRDGDNLHPEVVLHR